MAGKRTSRKKIKRPRNKVGTQLRGKDLVKLSGGGSGQKKRRVSNRITGSELAKLSGKKKATRRRKRK